MPKASKRPARRGRHNADAGNGDVKSEDLAAQLKAQLEEDEPSETVVMNFLDVRLRVRRFDIQGWALAGRMPQFLVNAFLEANAEGQAETPEEETKTPEEFWQEAEFTRDVVCYVAVEPRIVDKEQSALADGEISYKTFVEKKPKVCTAIAAWACAGCPNMSVALAGGGTTTVATVENFRESAGGAEASSNSASGAAHWQTEPSLRAI